MIHYRKWVCYEFLFRLKFCGRFLVITIVVINDRIILMVVFVALVIAVFYFR